jgi:hypothetical protein
MGATSFVNVTLDVPETGLDAFESRRAGMTCHHRHLPDANAVTHNCRTRIGKLSSPSHLAFQGTQWNMNQP